MNHLETTDTLFFTQTGLDQGRIVALVQKALHGADDGELFLEFTESEALVWDDGRIRSSSFDRGQGFGLRSVCGEAVGYAHASVLSEDAMRRAVGTARSVISGQGGGVHNLALTGTPHAPALFAAECSLAAVSMAEKVALLRDIDTYARQKDARVRQVSASLASSWQAVQIIRGDGARVADLRPLLRLSVSVILGEGNRQESGSYSGGGRVNHTLYFRPETWKGFVDEAIRVASVNLEAQPSPAGEMTVVLGSGWPGILLHEAIGHGLEGDFNRKKTSAFSGLLGQRVAAEGVTVVDDGSLPDRRGSLNIDDEGTPTQRTVLIDNGILVNYLQDRQNARLMGMAPTGNGRREGFAHCPMPRMTNTFMLGGAHSKEEIIASVKRGIYAANFGGGQVDITSGKFVFDASECYLIEDGKIGAPLRGSTLTGNGPDCLTKVSMIGNDPALDNGTGTCGKGGQSVPVGVGQPTLRIDGLTVGGTSV